MGADMTTSGPASSARTDSELIAQLATLQSLHDKIFELRSLLPERLLDPVKGAFDGHETPAALANHLRTVVVDGDPNVKDFEERWRSEGMKDVWERSKEASFPQGCDVWAVDYQSLASAHSSDDEVADGVPEDENVDEILEKFRTEHAKVKVERRAGESEKVSIDVTVAGYSLAVMRLDRSDELMKGHWLIAPEAKSSANATQEEMRRSLQVRPNHTNLKYLLDMIASYMDLKTRPCEQCHNIFDDDVQLPAVRTVNPKPKSDSQRFLAYHRGCL